VGAHGRVWASFSPRALDGGGPALRDHRGLSVQAPSKGRDHDDRMPPAVRLDRGELAAQLAVGGGGDAAGEHTRGVSPWRRAASSAFQTGCRHTRRWKAAHTPLLLPSWASRVPFSQAHVALRPRRTANSSEPLRRIGKDSAMASGCRLGELVDDRAAGVRRAPAITDLSKHYAGRGVARGATESVTYHERGVPRRRLQRRCALRRRAARERILGRVSSGATGKFRNTASKWPTKCSTPTHPSALVEREPQPLGLARRQQRARQTGRHRDGNATHAPATSP